MFCYDNMITSALRKSRFGRGCRFEIGVFETAFSKWRFHRNRSDRVLAKIRACTGLHEYGIRYHAREQYGRNRERCRDRGNRVHNTVFCMR